MQIEYRVITEMPDFEKVVDLEIAIWGLDPRDALPAHLLHTSTWNGGVCIAAYDQQRMVGMSFAFPIPRAPRWALWSHMTGVDPDYQRLGIGFELKQRQRVWAQAQGYRAIYWTFDPLQRGNANFNIRQLGARSSVYHVNYYGEMNDSINRGLPSDRIEVEWRVSRRNTRTRNLSSTTDPASFWLLGSRNGEPVLAEIPSTESPVLGVEIPADLKLLKQSDPQAALKWRLALRESLQRAFEQGYAITDFDCAHGRWHYILTVPEAWFMYVLECADDSLYTGITNDLKRRLEQHNSGKGAAYTAARRPVIMRAAWRFSDHSTALRAEAEFKQKPRREKLDFIARRLPYLSGRFMQMT